MLSWLRQKYAAAKVLRNERRVAKKSARLAADAAIKANPLLYKRAVHQHGNAMLRRWSLRAAFAVAVTGVTTVQPDLVSAPLDAHAAAHGVRDGLQQHFATQNIRVYHRRNPLMPFHLAGQMARVSWQNNSGIIGRGIGVPLGYASGLLTGFSGVIFPDALDAYSFADSQPHASRQCFIRPPGDINSATLLTSFTGIGGTVRSDDADNADSKRYYYTLVMAHEARHCDQDKKMNASALNEIDADLVADQLSRGILSEEETSHRRNYWAALRLTNAVVGNDVGHYSTPALMRGGITPMQAIDDAAVVRRLVQVLQDGEAKNRAAFPTGMARIERRYHLSLVLLSNPQAGDTQLRAKAALFVSAVDYLNGLTSGHLITKTPAEMSQRLDLSWLTQRYNPVPAPAAAPAPASPRPNS